MKYQTRIYYTETDKALMWDRWQKRDSVQTIAQVFERNHSSVTGIFSVTGGIRPSKRKRVNAALSLPDAFVASRNSS